VGKMYSFFPPIPRIIFGRDLPTGDLPQIGVDIPGVHGLAPAFFVKILKQLLSGERLAAPHDAGDPPIRDGYRMHDAALAAEFESEARARDLNVTVAKGSE